MVFVTIDLLENIKVQQNAVIFWSCSTALLNIIETYLRLKKHSPYKLTKTELFFIHFSIILQKVVRKDFQWNTSMLLLLEFKQVLLLKDTLQLNMFQEKPMFLFEITDLTGLTCFNAGYEAGHFNRVLTRDRSGQPKLKNNKFSEFL